jgi:hypothetical protein
MQHRGPTYNIILILFIAIPTCCGLAALGGAIIYATRSRTAIQPPPPSPLPIVIPTPPSNAPTLHKLGEQGSNDFLLANPTLIENPPQLEKQLREYCDRYRRDSCYLFVWRSKIDAALVLPMTDTQLNAQAAQYRRNKATGYDCFAMLKNGEMIKETMSVGCTPPTVQPTNSPVIPTQMPTITPASASALPTAQPTSSLVIPTRTPTITLAACNCQGNTLNCDDFRSQVEAQACYLKCGGLTHDIYQLDGNNDGRACESTKY